MVKFRIIGTPAEVGTMLGLFEQLLDIDEVSKDYPARAPHKVRLYVEGTLRRPVQAEAERIVDDVSTFTNRGEVDRAPRRALPPGQPRRRRRY